MHFVDRQVNLGYPRYPEYVPRSPGSLPKCNQLFSGPPLTFFDYSANRQTNRQTEVKTELRQVAEVITVSCNEKQFSVERSDGYEPVA